MIQSARIQDCRRILILCPSLSLAGAIVSSCCYREMKKANAQLKIAVVCSAACRDFLKQNAYVDRVYALDGLPKKFSFRLWALALKLRLKKYDVIVEPTELNLWPWRVFQRIVGFSKRLDTSFCELPFSQKQQPGSAYEQTLLEMLGVSNPDKSYDLPVPVGARRQVAQWLEKNNLSRYLLFYLTDKGQKLPLSLPQLKSLCDALGGFQLPILFLTQSAHTKKVTAFFGQDKNVFVQPFVGLGEYFEWVRLSSLVVSAENSAVAVAAGFEKPVCVLCDGKTFWGKAENPKAFSLKNINLAEDSLDKAALAQALEKMREIL